MSDEILRIINTYDDEVAKARTLKYGCQPTWADAKSKAIKNLSTLLSQELKQQIGFELRFLHSLGLEFIMKNPPIRSRILNQEARLKEINND